MKQLVEDLVKKVIDGPVQVINARPEFGDYAVNIARFASQAGSGVNEFATKTSAELKTLDNQGNFEKIEPTGSFINFSLSKKSLLANMHTIVVQRAMYGMSVIGQGKKVVFEYSSPNTNKALHIGHTRNDVYGKACINLLKAMGYQVISCEIINDRGIHIMKSVLMYQKFGEGKTPESEGKKPDHFVGTFYSMFGAEAAKSEAVEKQLLEEAQDLLKKWEDGDSEVRKVWKQMNDWFYTGVQETYKREGTTFDEVDFESEIYDKAREIVLAGVDKGIFTKEDDGSVSIQFPQEELGKKYLLRRDGTTIYVTQDLYLWDLRNKRHKPDLAIVTTAGEQAYHFKVLSELFKLVGYEWASNFKHLPYEHVFLGKNKMSSREGNAVTADQVVTDVKAKVKTLMGSLEKLKVSQEDEELVENLAFGAIKYAYLKYDPNTIMYFDLDTTISLEGNTGIYLQYAYARMNSILEKADSDVISSDSEAIQDPGSLDDIQTAELNLLRKLIHYPEVLAVAAAEYKPSLLCSYLYELAQEFSSFYEVVQVLKEPIDTQRRFRLQLVKASAQVIENGLTILGIEAVQKM